MVALVDEVQKKRANISGRLFRYTAQKYAMDHNIDGFRSSNSWFRNFCHRHNQAFKTLQVDLLKCTFCWWNNTVFFLQNLKYSRTILRFSATVYSTVKLIVFLGEGASVNSEGLQVWFEETLLTILENYELKDIWNCDELGLFYRQLPNKTLVNMARPLPEGREQRKEGVTVLLCGSATGGRFMPLVIGPSKNPPASVQNGVRDGKTEAFEIAFRNQAKAWMTQQIFNDYLSKLNDKMAKDNRKIAMILDNFQGHIKLVNSPTHACISWLLIPLHMLSLSTGE